MKNKLLPLVERLAEYFSTKTFRAIFSLTLSAILWYIVVGSQNEQIVRTIERKADIQGVAAGLAPYRKDEKLVSITVKGRRTKLDALTERDFQPKLDLSGKDVGTHVIPVKLAERKDIKIQQMYPETFEIVLTKMIDKTLAVMVGPPEDLPAGYSMDGASSSPRTVVAHGREDQLKNVFEVQVRPTFEQLKGPQPMRVRLRPPTGIECTYTPQEVEVEATYYENNQPVSRIQDVKITVDVRGQLPSYLRLKNPPIVPVPAKVQYTGRLGSVTEIYTEPLDLSQITGSTVLKLKLLNIPPTITILAAPSVDVPVEVEAVRLKVDFSDIPVVLRGADSASVWKIEPNIASVSVIGDAASLQDATPEKLGLRAYADVTGIVAQTAFVPVVFEKNELSADIELLPPAEMQLVKITRISR